MLFEKYGRNEFLAHRRHGDTRPEIDKKTSEKLEELGWVTVPHSSYSPDVAPSDNHLFCSLKEFQAKKKFIKVDHVKREVSDFFGSQSSQFWKNGTADLPIRWDTAVTNYGDYVVQQFPLCAE